MIAMFGAVLRAVSAESGLPAARIVGQTRDAWTSTARWMCWWLLHDQGVSKRHIGRLFGRHHASVIHGLRQLERIRSGDVHMQGRLAALQRQLRRAPEARHARLHEDGWGMCIGEVGYSLMADNPADCVSRGTGAVR